MRKGVGVVWEGARTKMVRRASLNPGLLSAIVGDFVSAKYPVFTGSVRQYGTFDRSYKPTPDSKISTPSVAVASLWHTNHKAEAGKKIKGHFLSAKDRVNLLVENSLRKAGIVEGSIAWQQKMIAMRSTILTRIYSALSSDIKNPFLVEDVDKLCGLVANKNCLIRLTNHPTEGQNLAIIMMKAMMVQAEVAYAKTVESGMVGVVELVNMIRICDDLGIEWARKDFLQLYNEIMGELGKRYAETELHHVEKMTPQQERDLLEYHCDRIKTDVARLSTKSRGIVRVDDFEVTTWAGDRDGKRHVNFGHVSVFTANLQNRFFISLARKAEDFSRMLELSGIDNSEFQDEILEFILACYDRYCQSDKAEILCADEAKDLENEILTKIEIFRKGKEDILPGELVDELSNVENYVKSSGCKAAKVAFTTREEVDFTNGAFFDLASQVLGVDVKAMREEEKVEVARKFMKEASNPEMQDKVAKIFTSLGEDSQRQMILMMEAASLNSRPEHITSQSDCELSSYMNVIALFEVAKYLPAHPDLQDHFKELSAQKQKEYGDEANFDFYEQFFSPKAAARAQESLVLVSPLAEEKHTIPKLAEFTRSIVLDPDVKEYIIASGGEIRQTRSNSDGSAAMGNIGVLYQYMKADSAVETIVAEADLKLHILQGIGANDLERLAPWNLELLMDSYTCQGGDMQHLTEDRAREMLLRQRDRSKEELVELEEKYGAENVRKLVSFYHGKFDNCEKGVEIDGGEELGMVLSGYTTNRGPIPGTVGEYLAKLSARPGGRGGDDLSVLFPANDFDILHKSVTNRDMRRIGHISLGRSAGMSSSAMAEHMYDPAEIEFDSALRADFAKIGLFTNNIISAVFGLGIMDAQTFKLSNGFDDEISGEAIRDEAIKYKRFLDLSNNNPDEAKKFAAENGYDKVENVRAAHMSYQLHFSRFILENALTPIIANSSDEVKSQMAEIFAKARDLSRDDYGDLVLNACQVLAEDKSLPLNLRKSFACAGQQVSNVRREDDFYQMRRQLVRKAHDALESGREEDFQESCENLAIAIRGMGNPASPGRKVHELSEYFEHSLGVEMPRDVEELSDSLYAGGGGALM